MYREKFDLTGSRAVVTAGVVTPNMVAATNGRPDDGAGGTWTRAATVAAALASTVAEIRLMPATSLTAGIITMSLAPT